MSTVKQLIELLQQLPEEAEVQVSMFEEGRYGMGGTTTVETLNLEPEFPGIEGIEGLSTPHVEITDCRTNPLMKEENRKVYVQFGGEL